MIPRIETGYSAQGSRLFIMRIFFVRHTEYDNPEDIYAFWLPLHLSHHGRNRASDIGGWLVKQHAQHVPIFTSPIVRSVQTAEIIAEKTHSHVTIDERLTEIYCPRLQGVKKPEKEAWKEESDPSREKRPSTQKRIMDFFQEKVKENKDCIAVSHGETITILYYILQNKPFPPLFWSPHYAHQSVLRGEILEVEIANGNVVQFQKITHLA